MGYATRKRATRGSWRCCVVRANALGNSQGQVKPLNSLHWPSRREAPARWCASDSSWCKSVLVVLFFPAVLFSSLFSLSFFPRCTRGSSLRVSCCPFLPAVFCRPTALFSRPFFGLLSSLPRNYSRVGYLPTLR